MNRIPACLFGIMTVFGAMYASGADHPTKSKPSPTLPNVPTFASLGLASVNPGSFRFLAGPAAMPRAVQQRLIAAMQKLAQMPELAKRMAENGYEPTVIAPPGSREYVFAEVQKWRNVVKESALKVN